MSEGLGNSSFTEHLENCGKIYGVMVGVVIKNDPSKDDSKPGPARVKVKIPLIGMEESNWARIASFSAGNGRGAFFLPEEGDEVLVAFENGDVNRPFVIGSLWNGKDSPPETTRDQNVIKSCSGHIIRLSDKKDEGAIEIKTNSGHIIKLDDKKGEENIQIADKSGNNKISIDTKGKKLSISSDKDIELLASKGKITINAKEIEIKSSAATKVEASAGMDLKASASMNIKGATVNIN